MRKRAREFLEASDGEPDDGTCPLEGILVDALLQQLSGFNHFFIRSIVLNVCIDLVFFTKVLLCHKKLRLSKNLSLMNSKAFTKA